MKALGSETSPRVITFVSYGSAYSVYGESPGLSPVWTISLRPVAEGSAALLLTKTEFDDFVPVKFPNHRFDESLLDTIFDLTTGHVGACVDLLEFTRSHAVSLRSFAAVTNFESPQSFHAMHGEADSKYTDEDFATLIPISHLVESAQKSTGVSWRGTPASPPTSEQRQRRRFPTGASRWLNLRRRIRYSFSAASTLCQIWLAPQQMYSGHSWDVRICLRIDLA